MAHEHKSSVANLQAILVGIDGSPASRNALRFAVGEAQALGCSIRLAGTYTVIRASVAAILKEAVAEVKTAGVPVDWVIETGDAADILVEESKHASLVVVGSHVQGGFIGNSLGTVSNALLYHAQCPTVVVPMSWVPGGRKATEDSSSHPVRSCTSDFVEYGNSAEPISKMDFTASVVVGVDALGKKSPALWEAAHVAEYRGGSLHIAGVITTTVGPEWLPSTREMKHLVDDGSEKLMSAKVSVMQKHPELTVNWTLFYGQPAEVLVRASDTADVVVIGTRARNKISRALFGSTSQSVLPYAECPTMVTRVSRDLY